MNLGFKNITYLLLIILITICCSPSADLSGKIEGIEKEGLKIYLIKPENLQDIASSYFGKVIDSAIIDAHGNFKFHHLPKSKTPVLLELAVQPNEKASNYLQTNNPLKSNYMPFVWQFGEPIKITASWEGFQNSFSIENPSKANNDLLNLRDINKKAYQTFIANKHWNVKNGSELLDKEHAILQYQTELMEFANSTQHLLPALVASRWVSPENDYERVPEFLVNLCNTWHKKQPENLWVKQLCEKSNPSNLPVLVGDIFPNMKLPMLSKDTLLLKNQLGKKLTVIDLWASWCAPCRKENRDVLLPLWNTYHNKGLQIIAYGLETDEATWKAAAEYDGADHWPQASDLQGDDATFLKQIRVRTIPANFILDHNGKVIAKNIHGDDLVDFVKSYMH